MKVIFTEVDGVLSNVMTIDQNGEMSVAQDCFAEFVRLVKKTEASVVITSESWKTDGRKMAFLRQQFTNAGIIDSLIGVTETIEVRERHKEIHHWLRSNPGVTKYAILDTFYAAQLPNEPYSFFVVDEQVGLDTPTVDNAISWLNQT